MTKQEALKECRQLMNDGAGTVEVFEWLEDNTDLDPADIISELFYL